MKLSRLFLALVACLMLAAGSAPAEMRVAVITVFDDINDTTSIQNKVNQIANLRYNAIAVHTRYRGDATYFPNKTNSTYPNNEPRSSAAGSIDVLQEFTTRGHAKGLKVFAYVNAYLVTDGSNSHPNSNHIINQHSSWVTRWYNNGNPIVQTTSHSSDGKWIDPGIPAAQDYVANICGDIMMNYNCDGIILDRIRYPQTNFTRTSSDFGYHPTAVSRFHAQYGGSGTPNPYDANWITFRQEQISATVEKVYETITGIDPNHILLAYPIGRLNDAINYNYQNWPEWLNGGYIDGVLPQIYTSSNSTFTSRCNEHIAAYSGPRLLGVATMAYQSGVDVDGQIIIANNKGFDGISPYRHGSMQSLGYFSQLQNVWTSNASWPAMPWKTVNQYIVDNTDPGTTKSGNWWASSTTPGFYGSNYHTRSTQAISDQFKWKVNLPSSGMYAVYVRWTSGANRPTNAPYTVYHAGGSSIVGVNQQINGGQWHKLGEWQMTAGNVDRVALSCWTTAGFYVVADAVRLVPVN